MLVTSDFPLYMSLLTVQNYFYMHDNFKQIYHGWAGYFEKYQSRDGQILSQDWNFSQIPCQTMMMIYLFNYVEYTFVPRHMRLHKKEISWT